MFVDFFQNDITHVTLIAKRTKSKNSMQITEFPSRFGQHKRVLREIQGTEVFVSQVFRNTSFCS